MNSTDYAKAYTEILEIIKYFPQEEYDKIPKERIEFFKNNMDKNYNFTIDPEIDLSEQNISKETNAIIISLFQDYFATENQKEKIKEVLKTNEQNAEIKKREKYNPDNLFKNTRRTITESQENKTEETALVEYKENFFTKFKSFIMRLLHIKNY